jgi:hypothetical protein
MSFSQTNIAREGGILNTSKPIRSCNPSPQNTARQFTLLRFEDSSQAKATKAKKPASDIRGFIRDNLHRRSAVAMANGAAAA